ncbi:hypothetical protein [Nocardia huaxiensis]|uniref:Uncharacterized protein n=1 Tax=Nocardia huaxiensis TaxID=2755382 RepID=A0A7D6ZTW2_9NOCA|nr:hypothetical protein [Nocardia huaxiensis]QLY28549.1 hypothetical protein H0264_24760 [Nocardia huaxiensis]UFS97984.1 hypothetical protein LPY97_08845 [Nocardia huaxiensis]
MRTRLRTDPLPTLAVLAGTAMVIAVPLTLAWLPMWADRYGAVLVYLAFLEYGGVAAGLVRWGVGEFRRSAPTWVARIEDQRLLLGRSRDT